MLLVAPGEETGILVPALMVGGRPSNDWESGDGHSPF